MGMGGCEGITGRVLLQAIEIAISYAEILGFAATNDL